jgi:hypothetical protein
MVNINLRLFAIISWITVHLGRNPMNGGSPPSDKSVMNSRNLVVAFLFTIVVWFTNEILNDLATAVTDDVSSE